MRKCVLLLFIGIISLMTACERDASEQQSPLATGMPTSTTIPTETKHTIPLETLLASPTDYIQNTLRPTGTPIPTYTPVALIPTFTPAPPNVYVTKSGDSPTDEVSLTTTPTSATAAFTKTPVITYRCGITPNYVPWGTDWNVLFWVQFYPQQSGLEFEVKITEPYYAGQQVCTGVSNGKGYASCVGSSGILPDNIVLTFQFETTAGYCETQITSY